MAKKRDDWTTLGKLITSYADASRADEMKGGGDPNSFEIIEAELRLSNAKLNAHIAYMRDHYEET